MIIYMLESERRDDVVLLFDPIHKVWDIKDKISEWTTINTDPCHHIQQAIQY